MNFATRGYACFIFLLFMFLIFSPATALASGETVQLTLGFTADSSTGISAEAAEDLGTYLTEKTSLQINAKGFITEKQLMGWLTVFREVQLAWLPQKIVDKTPIGELFILALHKGDGLRPEGAVVANQSTTAVIREQVHNALLSMEQSTAGQAALKQLGITHFVKPSTPKRVPTRTFSAKGEQLPEQQDRVAPKNAAPLPQEQDDIKPELTVKQKTTLAPRDRQPLQTEEAATRQTKDTSTERARPQKQEIAKPEVTAQQKIVPEPLGQEPLQQNSAATRVTASTTKKINPAQLVFGFAADSSGIEKSKAATDNISLYLQERLASTVVTRRFDSEDTLYRWLSRFREVDIAWLGSDRLKTLPVGELAYLVFDQDLPENTSGKIVSHQGLPASTRQEIALALTELGQSSHGKDILRQLGFTGFTAVQTSRVAQGPLQLDRQEPAKAAPETVVKAKPSRRLTSPVAPAVAEKISSTAIARQAQQYGFTVPPQNPRGAMPPKKVEAAATQSQKRKKPSLTAPQKATNRTQPLVLGLTTSSGGAHAKEASEELGRYLQQLTAIPVKARIFETEEALFNWLFKYREVDLALLSTELVSSLPVGELILLAEEKKAPGEGAAGAVVSHQGLSLPLQKKTSQALLSLQQSPEGQVILEKLGVEEFTSPSPFRTAAQKKPAQAIGAVPSPAGKDPVVDPEKPQTSLISESKDESAPAVVVSPERNLPQAASQPFSEKTEEPETSVLTAEKPKKLAADMSVTTPATKATVEPALIASGTDAQQSEPETLSQDAPATQDERIITEETSAAETANTAQNQERPSLETAQGTTPTDGSRPQGAEEQDGHSLSKLFGTNEVPVTTSVNDQYVENMADVQLMGEDLTRRAADIDLSKSIQAGRRFSRETLAANARTEQAEAQTGQAFGLLLPQVTVRVASGSETSEPGVEIDEATDELIESDTHERTDASLTVRQTLFDLPRYFDWRKRQVSEHVRKENQRISDGDAYLATVDSYLSLASSRLQADVTRGFEDQLAELLEYVEKRASAGAASVSDMARVRARIQATLSSRLEQEAAHATAGIEFVRLTNVAPNTVRMPEPKDIGEALLPSTFDQAVAAAMASNPEILALATELKAAKVDIKAAKSRYLPRLDAEYTDTYSIGAGGSKDKNGQRDMRLMAVLNWELFSGGKDRHYNVERSARHKELQYRLDDQRRRVVETLSANYTALETTRNRLATSYEELESISTAADAMTKRMLSGNQSLLDLLDVYDRYYQVRSRLVNLHILEMNTISQLIRLTHGAPWDEKIQTMWTNNEDS